jgi:polysaccharide export outer membrane protein
MKKDRLMGLMICLMIAVSISGNSVYAQEEAGQGQQEVKEVNPAYIISPNDILEISVYGESDLSTIVRVAQDGTINYTLLGNIKAGGLTVKQLETSISDLLGQDYLVMPQVSIFVKEYSKISIIGQVKSPGSYELKGNLTLTKAIALAGGFTDSANTEKVKIISDSGDKKDIREVNVDQILSKAEQDITIKSNDTILVEEYGRIFMMGQVLKPGAYNLTKGLTVMGAISLTGGFSPTAAPNGTRVIRVEDGKKKIIPVPAGDLMKGGGSPSKDILLQADDTVVVPESFF